MKKSVCARAIAMAFCTTAVGTGLPGSAFAQSNATGTIYGQLATSSGLTVIAEGVGNGVRRTARIESSGHFEVGALPPGRYRVTARQGDTIVSAAEVEVFASQGVEALLVSASDLQTVTVVGKRTTIDTSTTNNAVLITAQQLEALPVQRNLTSILLLAPNTVAADPRYAAGISIGGGGPSENAYYINGFPVTNPLSQLGSMELPYGAIANVDVQTGGYGAEFGRSVGGVLNVTTKSGSNNWEFGAYGSVEPNGLRSKAKNIYYPNTGYKASGIGNDIGNTKTDGTIYTDNSKNRLTKYQYGFDLGGPLIKDKLFFFLAADETRQDNQFESGTPTSSTLKTGGFIKDKDVNDRYLFKLDWNITDDHRVEYSAVGDNFRTRRMYYGYNFASQTISASPSHIGHFKNEANITPGTGGDAQIFRYVGNLTNDLTLTALYGQMQSRHQQTYTPAADNTIPYVSWTATGRCTTCGFTYTNPQIVSGYIGTADAEDKTKSFRLDLEYKIGNHDIRLGMDENKLNSENAGTELAGGTTYTYAYMSPTGTTNTSFLGYAVPRASIGAPGLPGYYVYTYYFNSVTGAQSDQSAQFIEDRWRITKNVLITAGLRNESFKNKNGDGDTFLKSDNFLSPRLGTSWDVLGDSSLKIFGSAGRYSLQIPTSVAVRGASRSSYILQYYNYTGVNPTTGLPTGLTALTPALSPDNELGQAKNPATVAAQGIKPTYQDEITLGMEKALARSLTFGAKVTYRKLRETIDDFCDQTAFNNYAKAHGIDETNYGGFNCATFNPGEANTFYVDYAGTNQNLTRVDLSAADLGFQKAQRTYLAFDFFLEHAFADKWYGKVNYTFSHSKGNTEGQTRSDNAQADVAITSTWDFPSLMENAYGNLPNDRTHQIKAYGYFQATPEWRIGANGLAQSGRPKNCFGYYGSKGTDPAGYGASYFYCNGQPSPRGSAGRLPWELRLDSSIAYDPSFAKGFEVRADVFNTFNRQSAEVVGETRDASPGNLAAISPTYGQIQNYTAPRSVRLTVEYNKHF